MTLPSLVPIVILLAVALIVWAIVERFSPDPTITFIFRVIIFVVVLLKLLPLLGIQV